MISATKTSTSTPARPAAQRDWLRETGMFAAVGALLMWAAQPPVDWGWLAWAAVVPWLVLVRWEKLTGWRPYRALWLAGFGFWLLTIHWLRLPHWATHFGWLALAFYMAFYVPVFVGLTRVAVHRVGISIVLAAPVVWMGLELARAHLLSGFLMGSLAHTQYQWPQLIQISDLGGAYAVGFVVMLVNACVARMLPIAGGRITWWPLAPAAAILAATLGYGHWRLAAEPGPAGPRVALIQGSIDADWKADPQRAQRIFDEYFSLSLRAVDQSKKPLALVVWPETMYRNALYRVAQDAQPDAETRAAYVEADSLTRSHLASMAQRLKTPLLIGIDAVELRPPDNPVAFNSAIGLTREGQAVGLYSKMHRVMFGEYIPFAKTFPWLYTLTPLTGGLEPGERPEAFEIEGIRYAPNICYESSIPQVIRNQVATLRAAGQEPDVLVNLTNDAWFWGSSELDQHLACAVFRAVECRKPFLIAANGGISAHIDSSGRILARSPKRQTDVILADVALDRRASLYLQIGDLPAGFALAACILLAGLGLWDRLRAAQARSASKR